MEKIEPKKSNPKIILLIAGINVFSILLVITLLIYTYNIKKSILSDYSTQFQNEVSRMVQLEYNQISTSMESEANWNDFADYTINKDANWYNEMYANPKLYKSDYIGVYGLDNKIINHTNGSKIKETDFVPKEALIALKKSKKTHFYLKTSDGIIQVFGITITKSNDTNYSKPTGYFILARKIDQSLKQKIEKITRSTITVFDHPKNKEIGDYTLHYKVDLKDNRGNFISQVYFERPFGKFIITILNGLFTILFIALALLMLSIIYTKKWVSIPLNAITKALETGDKESIAILKNTEGNFKNIGSLFEENTRQKNKLVKAKLKAEESDKLKSSFLSNLSHEIRTPMNAIIGFTELLLNTEVEKEEQLEYLSAIDKSGKNLIAIIDDLIEMSKIESHQTKPNYTAVNLESCINDLYESIKITNKKSKKIDFKIIESKNPALHPIKTDEVKLKQIITNLITNALKFTEQGSVAFGYEIDKKNNQLKFTVKDTGFGIEESDQKHIFDRFRRVGGDQSIKVRGLGLGLAISKAYVEMLGGTIALESKLGKGSEFSFIIPLEYIVTPKITVQPINQIPLSKGEEEGTILIAEDDNINFLLFQKVMKAKNYKIIRALNGQEAVDICLSNPNIDLVLMDIKMPLMNGFEALKKIQPIRPDLPIIAQTAFSTNEDKELIFKAGFYDYISKPINRGQLFEMIDHFFQKK
ncbi:response regulator [Flavobacterium sp. ZT3R18]|uniref:ATP-binding protein n=1 Tax=Flavobacterium sp. ZT3R18 TaxID=2594429 RepID=UPI00117AED04|nr:ATP-binding protein [Flavobacterium sp. ZT3R18]TRX37333.1 response regulator [Flavobacterium sp. ZT3R18]